MNTSGYFLLIAALLLLAGLMLYARFASRTREKSLHHAPFDWDFPPAVISSASAIGEEFSAEGVGHSTSPVEPVLRLERPLALASAPASDAGRDRDYLDDLQEAAAGLAKLMRSSPVARAEPVVFAPEEGEVEPLEPLEVISVAEGKEEEPNVALDEASHFSKESPSLEEAETFVEETSLEMTHEIVEVVEVVEVVELDQAIVAASFEATPVGACEVAGTVSMELPPGIQSDGPTEEFPDPVVEASDATAPRETVAPRVLSIRDRLGDSVAEQFDRIDESLDALESLVLSIEASLRALSDLENGTLDGDLHEEEEAVAAAA